MGRPLCWDLWNLPTRQLCGCRWKNRAPSTRADIGWNWSPVAMWIQIRARENGYNHISEVVMDRPPTWDIARPTHSPRTNQPAVASLESAYVLHRTVIRQHVSSDANQPEGVSASIPLSRIPTSTHAQAAANTPRSIRASPRISVTPDEGRHSISNADHWSLTGVSPAFLWWSAVAREEGSNNKSGGQG